MVSKRLGKLTVTRIHENVIPTLAPSDLFCERFDQAAFDRHLSWMTPTHYDPVLHQVIGSFHSWLIETPDHNVLVDTCVGNDKVRPYRKTFDRMQTPFLERLAAAGVTPDQVDFVMCTHLHFDHCGWNTRLVNGRWVPTFPNARYVFSRTECARWDTRGKPPARGFNHETFDDSVLPVLEANQAELIDGIHQLNEYLTIEPAPGHTAGNILMKLQSGSQGGVFIGDIMNHPIQVYHPAWNSKFCEHPEEARATRMRVLKESVDRDVMLFPMHFAAPYIGRVFSEREGFGFRFQD